MTLRERVFKGGAYLVLRQGLGVGISLVGVLVLTRLIGPADYGLYAGSLGITAFLSLTARMGIDVYLVRKEVEVDETLYHQAFSFLVVAGSVLGGVGFLLSPLIVSWMADPRFSAPLRVLFLLLPITVSVAPAVARLERALDYKRIAGLELTGQFLLYAIAVVLAWRGLGVWAPIVGYSLSQIWMLGVGCRLARYRPRLFWSWNLLREMLGYGLGYSSSILVWQLRILVNPLVVGRYLGAEGVGYIALTIRIVETLSFVREATWRISIAALAQVQQDLPRLRRALEEAMSLQAMAVSPLLAGFALVAPWLLPLAFGDQWKPVLIVFPFIALSYIMNAVFTMPSSVLYVLQRNWSVTVFHLVHVTLFAGTALLLVPEMGLVGYGLAETVALSSYVVLHLCLARVFAFEYNRTWPWLLAFVPPTFSALAGFPWGLALWVFALTVVLNRRSREQVRGYWVYFSKRGNFSRDEA